MKENPFDKTWTEAYLAKAGRAGASSGDLMISESTSQVVSIRLGEVEKVTQSEEKALGLRLFQGKQSAVCSTSDLSVPILNELITDTLSLARITARDESSGLPEPEALAKSYHDLDLFDQDRQVTIDEMIDLTKRAEAKALSMDPRIANSEGAEFAFESTRITLASTDGFYGSYRTTGYTLWAVPLAIDGKCMERDYWYTTHRKMAKLLTPEEVGAIAAERVLRRLHARKIKTCEVPVVFDPLCAGALIGHIASAINGQSIYTGSSFLVGRLNESIASPLVTIVDQGDIPEGPGSKPFDGEGLPTRKTVLIENGVLRSYLLDTYSARKLNLTSTGNAGRSVAGSPAAHNTNFSLEPTDVSPDDIIQSVKEGIFVTELIGFGVNLANGDFSKGAVGFWIENGRLAYPIHEVTIAGNLKDMLPGIALVGNDLDRTRGVCAPTLKISKMMVAGE